MRGLFREYAHASTVARTQLPLRVAACGLVAAVLAGMTGNWAAALLWYGVVTASLLASARVQRLAGERRLPRWLPTWSPLAGTSIVAVLYCTAGPYLWLFGGTLGPVGATLILTGGTLNVLVLQHRQSRTVLAGLSPFIAFLLMTPIWAGMTHGLQAGGAVLIGVVAFLGNGAILWRSWAQTVASERRSREELERRRAEAEAAVAAKSAFVAAVTHELRTPLSGVLAASVELQRAAEDPRQAECAAIVADSARFMRTLLGDLLDLAKMEAGRMEVEATRFDLGLFVHEVGRFWNLEAHDRGVPLRMDAALGLPTWVTGDPTRLRQVLNNLMSNALKFTGPEGVLWSVDAAALPGDRWAVTMRVRDFGAGIAPERLARLFTPFDQTDVSVARTHGGTGLGLAISRRLARLMGGDLTAESPPEGGAVFTLTVELLPAAAGAGEAEEAGPRSKAAVPAVATGALDVLVADDHQINRRTLGLLLEPLGAQVTYVEDGEAALACAAAQRFDLILMDVHMPVLDGLAAARRLRTQAGPNRATPVIAVTGADAREQADACLAAGMNGWVAKPLSAEALYAAISACLGDPAEPGEADKVEPAPRALSA